MAGTTSKRHRAQQLIDRPDEVGKEDATACLTTGLRQAIPLRAAAPKAQAIGLSDRISRPLGNGRWAEVLKIPMSEHSFKQLNPVVNALQEKIVDVEKTVVVYKIHLEPRLGDRKFRPVVPGIRLREGVDGAELIVEYMKPANRVKKSEREATAVLERVAMELKRRLGHEMSEVQLDFGKEIMN